MIRSASPAAPTTTEPQSRNRVLTKLLAGAVAVLLGAAGLVTVAAPATATPGYVGEVGGTVELLLPSNFTEPAGIDDVAITAYLLDEDGRGATTQPEWQAYTDGAGQYSFADGLLPAGDWAFEASYRGTDPFYVGEFSTGQYTLGEVIVDGDFIALGEAETSEQSFLLTWGGVVSGEVTTSTGTALAGQPIELWRYSDSDPDTGYVWELFAEATTDPAGEYVFTALPDFTYTVRAGGANGYAPKFFDNTYASDPSYADWLYVDPGTTPMDHEIANFELAKGATVSGTVKNSSGSALAGIVVTPYLLSEWSSYEVWEPGITTTTSKGTYSIPSLPPGSYKIGFASPGSASTQYTEQFWANKPELDAAASFTLASNGSKSGVNATMQRAASISGTITLAAGGFPDADDIEIYACEAYYVGESCRISDYLSYQDTGSYNESTGAYVIAPLPAGKFTVLVRNVGTQNFQHEWWGANAHTSAGATPISVAKGTAVTGRNIQLDPGATIQGTVRFDGAPQPGMEVAVYSSEPGAQSDGYATHHAVSGAGGAYTVTGLPAGEHYLRVEDGPVSAPWQWYGGGFSLRDAEAITSVGTATVTGIDIDLMPGATISGTVTGEDDGEAVDAEVALESLSTGDFYSETTTTDTAGGYAFADLPPGEYRIRASELTWNSESDLHLPGYHGTPGAPRSAATVIEVASGDTADADVALQLGGIYTGRIVDAADQPIAYADIEVRENYAAYATTEEDGAFRLSGLVPGPHVLEITGPQGFVRETLIDVPATTVNAAPVDLGDIALASESVISGVVIGTDGKPLRDVYVRAYMRDAGGFVVDIDRGTETDASGRFTLDGLPDGPIYLYFSPSSSNYPPQFLGGGDDWTFSEPVVLPAPGSTAYREVRLLTGGGIKGTVKNATTGRTIPDIPVQVAPTQWSTGTWGYALTNSKGAYSVPGLTAGGYEVSFNQFGTSPGMAYGSAEQTVYVPDRTTVTVNASLTPGYTVGGIVRGPDGTALPGVDVVAIPLDEGEEWNVTTSTTGAYEFVLLKGRWNLFFSDPQGRGGSVYLGGTTTPATATTLTVGAKALTGQNVTLPAVTGGIDVTSIVADEDADPRGTVTLNRVEDLEVVSSQVVNRQNPGDSLSRVFPIRSLADGVYQIVIDDVRSEGGDFGGLYPTWTSSDITVAGGAITTIPLIDLGAPDLWEASDWPAPVDGDGPVVMSDGTPQVGEQISADPGTWDQTVPEFSYQWMRNGKVIPGATGPTYDLAPGDAGRTVSVAVGSEPMYLDRGQGNGSVIVELAQTVLPGSAPLPVDPALIGGRTSVGQTLTADPGTWDLPGLTFGYRWTRNGSDIPGATSTTYKLTIADVGQSIAVEITAKRAGFENGYATADLTGDVVPAVAMKQTKPSKVTAIADGWSVSTGTWSPTGASYAYEWRLYEVDGTGYDTHASGTPQLVDAGWFSDTRRVTVAITATKAGYTPTTVEVPVRLGPVPTFDVEPVLSGDIRVGLPLTVDLAGATTTPTTVTYAYQWYKATTGSPVLIKGATGATYVPSTSDVAATLSVRITIKAVGYAAPTGPQSILEIAGSVEPPSTFTAGEPQIAGTPAVGRTLTAIPGTWTPVPTTFRYQWLRDGAPISKATSSKYVLTAADDGHQIAVRVTGSRAGYATDFADSHPTATITPLPLQTVTSPALPATARVGVKLTAGVGTWDLTPSSYGYQWYLNGVAIVGAKSSTYTPVPSDLGEEISVAVVAKRTGFESSAPESSARVTVVEGAAVTASKAPTLTVGGKSVKTVKLGQSIATTAGTWPVAALSLHYQWQVDRGDGNGWVALEGADAKTLYLDGALADDFAAGHKYRVEVTGTRTGYLTGAPTYSAALTLVP